jgi:hypothetical protein
MSHDRKAVAVLAEGTDCDLAGWLEVEDEGGPWTPAVADPERGHGLDIMRSLADDWGIEGDHDGRIVWARFDWPSP